MAGLAQRVLRNTVSSTGLRAILILINIFLVPFILHQIGAEAYGVWVLSTLLVGTIGLVDLGLGNALIKYTAELHARDDFEELSGTVSVVMSMYFFVSCLFSLAMVVFASSLVQLFRVPAPLVTVGVVLFIAAGGLIFLFSFYVVVRSLLIGLQRYDLANLVTLLGSLLNLALIVVLLLRGQGVYALLCAAALSYLFQGLLGFALVRHQCAPLRWSLFGVTWARFRRLLSFSISLQVISLGTFLNFHFPKVLLGIFAGMSHVAYYEIAYKVLKAGRELSIVLYSALFPAASHFWAQGRRDKIHQLYVRGTKYLAALTLPLWVFLVVFAQPIMRAWMGPGYEVAGYVLQVVGAGNALLILAGVAASIVQGSPRPQLLAYATVLGLALNVSLATVLGIQFGFAGIPAALGVALAISSGFFLARFHRAYGFSAREFLRTAIIVPASATIVSAAICYALYFAVRANYGMAPLPAPAAAVAIFGLLYLFAIRLGGFVDKEDIRILSSSRWTRVAAMLLRA